MKDEDLDELISRATECAKWPPHSKDTKKLVKDLLAAVLGLRVKIERLEQLDVRYEPTFRTDSGRIFSNL